MTKTRISRILSRVFKNEARFVDHHRLHSVDPLVSLLRMLHHFPFNWRKWLLNICRIQENPFENHHIHHTTVSPPVITFQIDNNQPCTITPADVSELVENFYESPLSLCILSYFVRAESTAHPDEFLEQRDQRIYKEVGAAICFDESLSWTQVKDYTWLNIDKDDYSVAAHAMFTRGLRRFRTELSRHHSTLLLPYASDQKNTGYTTQHLYRLQRGETLNEWDTSVTTGDLLRHYAETGNQTGGPMEVRLKWGFNDLQARVYYALGGDGYFSALYIKQICNKICEILPSTNPHSRFDTTRIRVISTEEIVVTYDYTAFTTSLSELKYFMHYLADQLDGIEVDVLDVYSGIVTINLREYIHHYNRKVNVLQEFQINRLFHGVDEYFRQGRSGSLGTQGNIVFSTSFHGIHLGEFTGTPYEDSCVGDDALVAILASLLPLFISHVNHLGTIHPEKFTLLTRRANDSRHQNRQAFKYLKRPVTVDFIGQVRTGILDAFPDLFTALGYETDSFRTPDNLTFEERAKALVTQWARFLVVHLDDPTRLSYALEDHLYILLEMIGVCYDDLGIPRSGCIPSQLIGNGEWRIEARFYAPPCDDLSVFQENWLDLLYRRFSDEGITIPYTTESLLGPEPDCLATHRTRCSAGHPVVRIMEVLKKVKRENIMVYTTFTAEVRERESDRIFRAKGHTLAEITFYDVPEWFSDVLMYFLEDYGLGDPFEAMSDYNTIVTQ